MAASAEKIWALVSDVTAIGKYSPETFDAEWLDVDDYPAVGSHFRGHVKRNGIGPIYWSTCVVTAWVPNSEFGFSVLGPGHKALNTWHYLLEPVGESTEVTESFRLPEWWATKVFWPMIGRGRTRTNLDSMYTTLDRIRTVVERSS